MKMRSTERDHSPKDGGSVVELESMWQPDAGSKPFRIGLNFAVLQTRAPRPDLRRIAGAGVVVAAVFVAGFAGVGF